LELLLCWIVRGVVVELRDRMRGYLPGASIFVAVGSVFTITAIIGFVALADTVLRGETKALDVAVLRWLGRHRFA